MRKWARVIRKSSLILFGTLLLLCFLPGRGLGGSRAEAAGANVTIQTKNHTVTEGDTFYVLITVESTEVIDSFDSYFSYNNRYLRFETGGSVTHGNDDRFRIEDTDREEGAKRIKYAVKFHARKKGNCTITLKKPYKILSGDSLMSVSYNSLNIVVKGSSEAVGKPKKTPAPAQETPGKPGADGTASPAEDTMPPSGGAPERTKAPKSSEPSPVPPGKPDKPGSNRLRSLKVEGMTLVPEYSPKINKYSGVIVTDKKELDITYEPQDSQASVEIRGNQELEEGRNVIRVVVSSRNGEKNTYRITATLQKGGEAEAQPEWQGVTVQGKKGKFTLTGTTRLRIKKPGEGTEIPEGFTPTETMIDGKSVPSYTLEGNQESSFVLLYGKGEEEGFYLYDLDENLILPYEKVKSWYRYGGGGENLAGVLAYETEIQSLHYLLAIMGVFCVLILILAILIGRRGKR